MLLVMFLFICVSEVKKLLLILWFIEQHFIQLVHIFLFIPSFIVLYIRLGKTVKANEGHNE